jgi:putative ABC transport system permease protein
MFRTTLKNLAARKLRLALTALSVVLGVGFIAGTFVLTDTMNHAFDELFSDATSGVDVYVRASDYSMHTGTGETTTVPESVVAEVQAVDGVESAVGSVDGYAQFIAKDGEPVTTSGAPTLGASWSDGQSSGFTIRDGRMPGAPGEVLVDAKTAETQGYEVGDRVKILLEGPVQEFRIVGTAGYGEADNLGGATMAVFDLATAQELFNKSGELDSIEVTSDGSQDDAALVDAIGAVLPEGYGATSSSDVAEEQSASIKDQLGFFTTSLLVFAGIAVLVGGFIIFNTFSIVVAQRTREFALLKSLGASGRQITTSVLTEATLVGIVASIVGLGAGVAIASGLRAS